MVKISRSECLKLQQQFGYKFGSGGQLNHTWNNHKPHTYYLVENEKTMNDLKKIRNQEV